LSKFRRKPWVFELRDIWPESIQSVGAMRHQRILNILEKIELGLYRDSNQVIAVTNSFKQNLISRGIEKSKISVVTNGSNLELFYSRDKDQELLNKLNLNNKFIIGYIGTHGMAHGLDFIIRAISKIDSSIHFLFVGNGAMKEIIVNLAKELNIKNVTFIEPIPKDEVPRYLSIVDVSLVPLKKSNTFKGVIPSKIFEASSMRIPTLLGVEGEVKGIIESYNAGISYEPENEEDFISKVYELKYNKKLYENIQKNSIKLAIDYNRKILANKMLNILQSIAKKKKKKVLFLKGKTV
jgi:glycosyltransferase involved in cell wall biosynthesis